jgi:hypothetical protein
MMLDESENQPHYLYLLSLYPLLYPVIPIAQVRGRLNAALSFISCNSIFLSSYLYFSVFHSVEEKHQSTPLARWRVSRGAIDPTTAIECPVHGRLSFPTDAAFPAL